MSAPDCDHEYTLNVQLTHAWCQRCDLVIPMVADGVRDTIAAQATARERQRIRQGATPYSDGYRTGYLIDADLLDDAS